MSALTSQTNHASPYAIRVRNLWQRFGAVDVLRDVSFDVPHGEVFGFIGPNGAGKTTTIRIMATLAEPSAGRVEVDGYDVVVDADKVRRLIGYMPDHAGVYERVTVREYLQFFAEAYGITARDPDYAVVNAVMDLTDLRKLDEKLVSTMSKGMKQRLQLARTLLHDPKVLILDEPASDLDPRARIEMRDLIVELRKLGKTIFLSSHILTELADVCTSVAILERGRLIVTGPIHDIGRRLEAMQRAQAVGRTAAAHAATTQGAYVDGSTPHTPPMLGPLTGPESPAPQVASTRSVRFRFASDVAAAHAFLRDVSLAKQTAPSGGALLVECAGDDATVASLVTQLVAAGHLVCGVEPERNELERIFLEVTKGDLQ